MKAFASQADVVEQKIAFTQMAPGCYAYTAEGDPNSGVIIGDDGVVVIDTQATPEMARDVLARIRALSDKPVKFVVLSHYHAVRVLGASAYHPEHIVASRDTRDLIAERGAQDKASEISRFPRLFRGAESIPGLTWPTITFSGELTLWLGSLELRVMQLGRGHTKGDTVVWVPQHKVLYAGDLVEAGATPYSGDAYLSDWPSTLERVAALAPNCLVPGRGPALLDAEACQRAIRDTRSYVSDLFAQVGRERAAGHDLKQTYREAGALLRQRYGHWFIFDHCLPFNVSRAYDEASAIRDPRIWTDARDREMWSTLEG